MQITSFKFLLKHHLLSKQTKFSCFHFIHVKAFSNKHRLLSNILQTYILTSSYKCCKWLIGQFISDSQNKVYNQRKIKCLLNKF